MCSFKLSGSCEDSRGSLRGLSSFVYGAYLLNRYTRWDAGRRMVTFNYLMSTGCPYQVQIMETTISFDET